MRRTTPRRRALRRATWPFARHVPFQHYRPRRHPELARESLARLCWRLRRFGAARFDSCGCDHATDLDASSDDSDDEDLYVPSPPSEYTCPMFLNPAPGVFRWALARRGAAVRKDVDRVGTLPLAYQRVFVARARFDDGNPHRWLHLFYVAQVGRNAAALSPYRLLVLKFAPRLLDAIADDDADWLGRADPAARLYLKRRYRTDLAFVWPAATAAKIRCDHRRYPGGRRAARAASRRARRKKAKTGLSAPAPVGVPDADSDADWDDNALVMIR